MEDGDAEGLSTLCRKVLDMEKSRCTLVEQPAFLTREGTMNMAHPTQTQESPSQPFRELFANAVRFWEPWRLLYNLLLSLVVAAWVITTWPHFRPAMRLQSLLLLVVLGLIANLCYCAAYLIDIPMQQSPFWENWKRRRWALWLVGMLFAILLANYWIVDEIYPFVG
jgi:hypothetical protein